MPKRYPHILLIESPTEFPFTSSSIPIKKRIPTNRNRQIHSDLIDSISNIRKADKIESFWVDNKHLIPEDEAGWWRERNHLKKWDKKTRYSLVVTIKTPEETVDIYTRVAIKMGIIGVPVEIEISSSSKKS
jgi:hypothetical protein